ncbi:GNAT family N-acetyltransferase [Vallitalea okinawensis]|uniref:GNAT family N-acetyltransferase n=1 Tax=Vallitalea okinawensis TaxID=2078660 RepID=UPI0014785030|nr:GNAT family N-acetyltransferase [Vallitalea okinawensis]
MKEASKISIRKAQSSDIEQIFLFEREYIIEHEPEQLAKWDSVKYRTMELLVSNLKRMFVATVDGQLAGHGYWSIYLGQPCIYSIYLLKDYRLMGIAAGLMKTIEKQIFDNGHKKITLSTLVTNPAQHFFDKMSYEVLAIEDGWIHYSKTMK